MFTSSTFRLAALYSGLFALAVVILGAVTILNMRAELTRMFDASLQSEAHALSLEFGSEGLDAVVHAVRDRDQTPGHLNYGLEAPGGVALAGRLAGRGLGTGWSDLRITTPEGTVEHIRVLGVSLPDGHELLVGEDLARSATLDGAVLGSFSIAFVGLLLLGMASGYGLSRGVHRRLNAITGTAEAIIDGDLGRRVPTGRGGDDLDRLAGAFNRMLDRISSLMESLRHVSSDIAHDLRTPLHRLRTHLEAGLAETSDAGRVTAIQRALAEMDDILKTFTALLRIAQVESGERRSAFGDADLAGIAEHVVEAFAPSAEEDGRTLVFERSPPTLVDGDSELLTQMLVNLVENALRHTPPGAFISVGVQSDPDGPILSVTDDGPGIAAAEHDRVFQRFYRLEVSRTTPGDGLGLSLVAAVARLHGARIALHDARPGLRVDVLFPA